MYNGIPPNMHGIYSSYSERIKHSQDNALLLPASYVSGRRQHLDDSDDDLEDMLENSGDEEDVESVTPAAPHVKPLQEQNLRKFVHRKNALFPPTKELLDNISESTELLVPIRLDIDLDEVKLRDVFVWNMNGMEAL